MAIKGTLAFLQRANDCPTEEKDLLAHKVHVPLVALVLASLVLLSLGALVGTKLSWGTKNPRTVDGVAVLHNPANSLGGFQADDGGVTAAFDAKTVSWVKGEEHGEGDKPC